jgi:hypothetical protein
LEGGGGVEGVVGAVQFHVIYNAGDWQFDGAGNVSLVRVAAITRHSADKAVFLLRPDCGLEGESIFGSEGLLVVGIVLLDTERCCQQQTHNQKFLGACHGLFNYYI